MHSPTSLTTERLWAQAQALLDARQDPLADPAFADAFADALGEALQRTDAEAAPAHLDELQGLLATVHALPPAECKPTLQSQPTRRFPWAAALAAALLLVLSQRALKTPHAEPSKLATANASVPANAQPQTLDWAKALQPAAPKPRNAIVRLNIERNAVLPRTNAHASLKHFASTSKQNR